MNQPANQPEPSLREEMQYKLLALKDAEGKHVISSLIASDPFKLHALIGFIQADEEAAVREAKLNTEFLMASKLSNKMMPLMVHSKEPDFPSMTKEILDQIWLWSGESIANWLLSHPQAGGGEGK